MLEVNIYKYLKGKKEKARINGKKVITLALPCLRETLEWNTCFGPRKSKINYQNSRWSTIPTFNMIKDNRYDNRRKITRTSSKIFQSIKIYIFYCLPRWAKPLLKCLIKAKFTYLLHFLSFRDQTCQIDYDC